MRILVTAGNTQTPIDQVRCLTNIFTGRTGTRIALTAYERGHEVVLLTSHPEVLGELSSGGALDSARWASYSYRTFEELERLMAEHVAGGRFDAVIHAAAINDYRLDGVFTSGPSGGTGVPPVGPSPLPDASRGKIKGSHAELWLRLVPTPKLVDRIRQPWGFQGVLVKFKLEVGVSESELQRIAEQSRLQSAADLMVANTIEGKDEWALVGPIEGIYHRVERGDLAERLLKTVEATLPTAR